MDLQELRTKLDQTDDEILRLFLQRMDVIRDVAALKKEQGGAIARPSRER